MGTPSDNTAEASLAMAPFKPQAEPRRALWMLDQAYLDFRTLVCRMFTTFYESPKRKIHSGAIASDYVA